MLIWELGGGSRSENGETLRLGQCNTRRASRLPKRYSRRGEDEFGVDRTKRMERSFLFRELVVTDLSYEVVNGNELHGEKVSELQ